MISFILIISHNQVVRLICLLIHGLVFSYGSGKCISLEMIGPERLVTLLKRYFMVVCRIMWFLREFHTFGIRNLNNFQVLLTFNYFYS